MDTQVIRNKKPLNEEFSVDWYLKAYPDVEESGISPLEHYQKFGKAEGRLPRANVALELEKQLLHEDESFVDNLQDLTDTSIHEYEMVCAHWALARWYASNANWLAARKYIDLFVSDVFQVGLPQNQGPTLLALTVLCECGELKRARWLLDSSPLLNKGSVDYQLALCLLNQVETGKDKASLSSLDCVYSKHRMAELDIVCGKLTLDTLKSSVNVKVDHGPLVSVVIPSYNSSSGLATAVHSLLAQTWRNLEIIIVDDASTDDSLRVAEQLSKLDSRIKVYKQHTNQGAYIARNVGLHHANGEYITVHDADDYSHCQKIQLQVEALQNNVEACASVSHWARCTTDLKFGTWRQEVSWVHRNVSSLMFRRSVFDSLGYWDAVSVNADTEYYYRILSAFGKTSIIEVKQGIPLAFGRIESGNLTQNPKTHLRTQFKGVRKDYMDAAHQWHNSKNPLSDLYMPFKPRERLFDAPEYIKREVCFLTGMKSLKGSDSLDTPYYLGQQNSAKQDRAVLLCAHMTGETLYGAERSFIDMAKALHDGHKKLIIALPAHASADYRSELLKYCSALVVVPYTWWRGSEIGSSLVVKQLEHVINEFNVKLVAVNTLVISAPLIAAKKLNLPTIMHVRELPDHDPDLCGLLNTSAEAIKSKLNDAADVYIANSICTASYISQPNNSHVLHNTVNVYEFDIPLPRCIGGLTKFALISSNTPKKGVDDFIKLAKRAVVACPNARFLLVGPINEYIKSLMASMPANVEVCGYKGSPQEAIAEADVVMNLSHFQESFGRTVSEAMAAKRPVVAYRWGALPELIDNGINGYLVPFSDIEGLLSRVKVLTDDAEFRYALGMAAKQKMIEQFGFESFSKTINKIYGRYFDA